MRMIIASAALAFAISGASAQVNVVGEVDCGKWIKARTEKASIVLEGFIQGLLNGMALGSGIEFWDAGGVPISPHQVFLWMDNYCRTKPLSDAYDGAEA